MKKLAKKAVKILSNLIPLPKKRFVVESGFFSGMIFGREKGLSREEAKFLHLLTRMIKPDLALETGACLGYSTAFIGYALAEGKAGHCHSMEANPFHYRLAKSNIRRLGLAKWVTIHEGDSREAIRRLIAARTISKNLDLIFLDSGTPATVEEFELLKPHLKEGTGYLVCHDVFCPRESGKGVILYPYIRDKYPKEWDVCVLRTGGAGFMIARKRGSGGCDAYKSLDFYAIKDFEDYLANWLPKIIS